MILANADHVILVETHYHYFVQFHPSAAYKTSDLVVVVMFYHDTTSFVPKVANEMHGTIGFTPNAQNHSCFFPFMANLHQNKKAKVVPIKKIFILPEISINYDHIPEICLG